MRSGSHNIVYMMMTQQIARAAAQDAGNRSMRAAGRSKWNRADYNSAVAEFNRLWDNET